MHAQGTPARPAIARGPVLAAMVTMAVALTVTSTRYGYHRDELYFRMLKPSWGYVDEPPFTPLVARLTTHLADAPWAMHLPATALAVASVWVLALLTRELGGGRRAQALCGWGFATASLPLIMGHVLLTSTVDLLVWPAVLLAVVRAQVRDDGRWWLVAGAMAGLSTYNKLLIALLVVALAIGVVVVGPRRLIWSRPVLGGAAIAVLLAVPNLVYQAVNGWPQLSMGRALADENAGSVRALTVPMLLLILGPPLVPIWIAGLVRLWRTPALRFLAAALPVLVLLVMVMGTQFYYTFGLLAAVFAAGCVPTADWMRGRLTALVWAGVALDAIVNAIIGLPVLPLSVLGSTPVPGINQVARDTVGWQTYVREVAGVYDGVGPAERAHTIVLASNYGEAGAIARYGDGYQLPAVFSGLNDLYYSGPPPAGATTAVVVGGQFASATRDFASCTIVARLDNRDGVDNEEQHKPIGVCRDPVGGWGRVWPLLKHLG